MPDWFDQNLPPSPQTHTGGTGGFDLPQQPLSQMPSIQDWQAQHPNPNADPMDEANIRFNLLNLYQQQGKQPTGPGSGPTDIAYFVQKIKETGGWTPQNAAYWQQRIPQEITKAASGGGAGGAMGGAYTGPGAIPPPFQSPSFSDLQNDPGYQGRLQEGQLGLQRMAAAKGSLLSGGFAKSFDRYNQQFAANEYQNSYNRSLQNYQQNYLTQSADPWRRYMDLYQGGLNATGQLGASGKVPPLTS